MSKLGWKVVMGIAEPIVGVIRGGKPIPTTAGAILGAALGTTAGLAMIELLPPGALLGAILGATAGAGLFQLPPRALGERRMGEKPKSMGGIRHCWTFQWNEFKSVTVLMDRAVYVVRHDKAPWDKVREKLESGIDPGLPLGDLIRIEEIERVEFRGAYATELQVVYRVGSRIKRRGIDFMSVEEREGFLYGLEGILGGSFQRTEERVDRRRAMRAPVIVLLILAAVTVAGMLLSWYWITNPPAPLRTGKQDDLVRLLSWSGPQGVLLAFGIPLLISAFWLVLRVARPPRILVLRLETTGSSTGCETETNRIPN
jgi:hypothetical protein